MHFIDLIPNSTSITNASAFRPAPLPSYQTAISSGGVETRVEICGVDYSRMTDKVIIIRAARRRDGKNRMSNVRGVETAEGQHAYI